jgi:peptidoglycan/LPS O-acetylase OafA/YrhL
MKIDQLTGMRFVAAMAVFLSHLGLNADASMLGRIFAEGYVGVSFFFVLSGFVLSHSYSEKLRRGDVEKRTYVLLRFARITPLHFLTALPFIIVTFSEGWKYVGVGLVNLAFLQSWVPHSSVYFSLNAPSWSLSNEIFFYSAFLFLAYLSFNRLIRVFAFLACLVLMTAAVIHFAAPSIVLVGSRSVSHWLFYIFPGFRLLEFVAGMLVFEIYNRGLRLPSFAFPLTFILLIFAMSFGKAVPEEFRYSLYYLPFVCVLLFSSLNVAGCVRDLICSRGMVFLGNASFAFYLLHQPILAQLKAAGVPDVIGAPGFAAAGLVAVVVASSLTYVIFERPVERALKRRILGQSRVSAAAGP